MRLDGFLDQVGNYAEDYLSSVLLYQETTVSFHNHRASVLRISGAINDSELSSHSEEKARGRVVK